MMQVAHTSTLEYLSFGVDGLGSVARNTSTGKGNQRLGSCLRCKKTPEQVGGSDYWAYRKIVTEASGQAIQNDARKHDLSTSKQSLLIPGMCGIAWHSIGFWRRRCVELPNKCFSGQANRFASKDHFDKSSHPISLSL